MLRKLVSTSGDPMLTLLRITLGIIFFAHGAQKVLGWFGGSGYSGTLWFFTRNLGLPEFLAAIAIWTEFLGGILLFVGFLGRLAGLGIAIDMAVAMFLVHIHNGLFMNWFGNQPGEGFEYHLLAIAIALMITVRGAGAYSIDHAMQYSRPMRHPHPFPA